MVSDFERLAGPLSPPKAPPPVPPRRPPIVFDPIEETVNKIKQAAMDAVARSRPAPPPVERRQPSEFEKIQGPLGTNSAPSRIKPPDFGEASGLHGQARSEVLREEQMMRSYMQNELGQSSRRGPVSLGEREFSQGLIDMNTPPDVFNEYAKARADLLPYEQRELGRNLVVPQRAGDESYYDIAGRKVVSDAESLPHETAHSIDADLPTKRRIEFLTLVYRLASDGNEMANRALKRAAADNQGNPDPQHVFTFFALMPEELKPPEIKQFLTSIGAQEDPLTPRSLFEELAAPFAPARRAMNQAGRIAAAAGDYEDEQRKQRQIAAMDPATRSYARTLETADFTPRTNIFQNLAAGAKTVGGRVAKVPISPYQNAPSRYGNQEPRGAGETAANLYKGARTDIPYSEQVSKVAGDVGAQAAMTLPGAVVLQILGENTPLPTPQGVGREIGELVIPREVWELALELVPGIGTIPDLARAVKRGAPEAVTAMRRAMIESEAGQRWWAKLGSETGALGGTGEPEDVLRAAGDVTSDVTNVPRDVTEPGTIPSRPAEGAPSTEAVLSSAADEGAALPAPKPPTIAEVEARSKPLTPAQRARITREVDQAIYAPGEFTEASDRIIKGTDNLQKVQDVFAKIPVLREFGSFMEPIASGVAKAKVGEPIPLAMVKRDLYASVEKSRARVAVMGWLSENTKAFGLNGKGIAKNVEVREGANIPAKAKWRLDDIIEHTEDYNLTPEQAKAIEPLLQSQTAVLQRELEAGVDVREVQDAYVARVVTSTPKGEPRGGGGQLSSRPGHAKLRAFPDVRSGIAAGFDYASPIEAITHRLETGIDAIANRKTLEQIKTLGEKPSERVPQGTRDAYMQAKSQFIGEKGGPNARTPENAATLDVAKRDLRQAATRANQPRVGEAQAFGRIFPESVVKELGKYTDITDPGVLEQFFAVQRASATSSDMSALFIQGGNLLYRNFPAWVKSAGYSVAALARDPIGYVVKNADAIDEGIKFGAVNPPSEFLLRDKAGFTGMVGRLPVIKQTQRAFEWFTFVGQTEWWKGAKRLAKTDADKAEIAAVIRKGTGTMLRPGLTKNQRKGEIGTFFAGRFLMAVNVTAADALRGGVRGAEARKTMGLLFGGATSLTIAGQLATDGTMPNLTNPNDRDKPWLSIKRPGGTLNLYGPLYPYMKAYASISQNLIEGKPRAALGDARFLAQSRLSLPITSAIDLYLGHDVVGGDVKRTPEGLLKYLGERFIPISERQLIKGGVGGQQEFPEGNLQLAGGRANRASDYRQKLNASERFLDDADGDFSAAYEAAIQAGDQEALEGIESVWRKDFEKRTAPLGIQVVKGAFAEVEGDDLYRAPSIEFDEWNAKEKAVIPRLIERFPEGTRPPGEFETITELRSAMVDYNLQAYMQRNSVGEVQAREDLTKNFNAFQAVKNARENEKVYRLNFWREHPDLLREASTLNLEDLNEDEREILEGAATE